LKTPHLGLAPTTTAQKESEGSEESEESDDSEESEDKHSGTQFTRFTRTKVQILTQQARS
jgi:hypothetical protein